MLRKKAWKILTNLLLVSYYKEKLIISIGGWGRKNNILGFIAWNVKVCLHYFIYRHVYIYPCKYIYIYTCKYIYIYISIYVYILKYTYVYIYILIYISTHKYIYIYIHIYIYRERERERERNFLLSLYVTHNFHSKKSKLKQKIIIWVV